MMAVSQNSASGRGKLRLGGLGVVLLVGALVAVSCEREASRVSALTQEVKGLQEEVARLQDRVTNLEAVLQKVQGPAPGPAVAQVPLTPPAAPEPPPVGEVLTVDQLLKQKEQFLGGRVTVQGRLGLVLIHRKSFFLKGQQGMLEVLFAELPEKNTVQRLISQDWPGMVVATGTFAPSAREKTGFQLTAENIELQ